MESAAPVPPAPGSPEPRSPRAVSRASREAERVAREPSGLLPARLGRVPLRVLFAGGRTSAVLALVYVLLFNLSVVRGSSMRPGIEDGDRILVETWSYLFGDPGRGDVVVMRYPLDPSIDYIKRVVGLPGDRVTCAGGEVWVNGERLDEPYVEFPDHGSYLSVTVQPEHYFVLGDNRRRSSDSRDFGQVPTAYVRGRVDLRLWPLDRAGWIQ